MQRGETGVGQCSAVQSWKRGDVTPPPSTAPRGSRCASLDLAGLASHSEDRVAPTSPAVLLSVIVSVKCVLRKNSFVISEFVRDFKYRTKSKIIKHIFWSTTST